MKKLLLIAFTATAAVSVFAQGTVYLNNRVVGSVITHVYAPLAPNSSVHQVGNGTGDYVAGSTDWSGYTALSGGNYLAELLGANGANQSEESLQPMNEAPTNFRTGAAAGWVNPVTAASFNNIPGAASVATFEMVVWDNSSGLYSTWAQASVAWQLGLIAAAKSNLINVNNLGGVGTTAPVPALSGLQSFNIYYVPEPSTFALAGLGAAAMLIFRRRK
jgi:hypothetical protein